MTLQLFVWVGHGEVQGNRIHYSSFTLNEQTYKVGECVYLYPEDEQFPPYIARILRAFVDRDVQNGADPHCIEVKWFERRVNLEPSTKGIEESEREVFELEDTDINPIGCISGKCKVVKADNYEEAHRQHGDEPGWFFCRGYFHQSTNSFVAYTPAEMAANPLEDHSLAAPDGNSARRHPPLPQPPQQQQQQARAPGSSGSRPQSVSDDASLHAHALPQDALPSAFANGGNVSGGAVPGGAVPVAAGIGGLGPPDDFDEEPEPPVSGQRRQAQSLSTASQPANKRQKATGRTCVECGATSTPQWREGPQGPKTLCNACGVRYVRSQQKAAGHKRSGGGPKNGQRGGQR